jgi:hypothetical protein
VVNASRVVQVVSLHENCICIGVLGSVALKVNDVVALFVYVAHPLIEIVQVGGVVSGVYLKA